MKPVVFLDQWGKEMIYSKQLDLKWLGKMEYDISEGPQA